MNKLRRVVVEVSLLVEESETAEKIAKILDELVADSYVNQTSYNTKLISDDVVAAPSCPNVNEDGTERDYTDVEMSKWCELVNNIVVAKEPYGKSIA